MSGNGSPKTSAYGLSSTVVQENVWLISQNDIGLSETGVFLRKYALLVRYPALMNAMRERRMMAMYFFIFWIKDFSYCRDFFHFDIFFYKKPMLLDNPRKLLQIHLHWKNLPVQSYWLSLSLFLHYPYVPHIQRSRQEDPKNNINDCLPVRGRSAFLWLLIEYLSYGGRFFRFTHHLCWYVLWAVPDYCNAIHGVVRTDGNPLDSPVVGMGKSQGVVEERIFQSEISVLPFSWKNRAICGSRCLFRFGICRFPVPDDAFWSHLRVFHENRREMARTVVWFYDAHNVNVFWLRFRVCYGYVGKVDIGLVTIFCKINFPLAFRLIFCRFYAYF